MNAVTQKDNSTPARKIHLRKKYLPKNAVVLDCFCGSGIIYHSCYEDVKEYHGLDTKKIHGDKLCEIVDNRLWIKNNDINKFTVFDLDSYGSPWLLLFKILKKATQKEIVVFLTDGIYNKLKRDPKLPHIISATEQIPKNFTIPGLTRYYPDIIGTLFLRIKSEYGYTIEKAVSIPNCGETVQYWYLKFVRREIQKINEKV